MATTLGIQDSFSTSDHERGSPPGRPPMSRYIPGDVCPFLPPAWHLGWLDFGWVVRMLPGGTDGRETQMGTRASVLDGRTRELGRAGLGFGVFSPFQENGVQRSSGGILRVSQVALVLKKPPASAGDIRDVDSMLGLGRSSGGGHGNPPSILAWRISWTEEAGGLQSTGVQSRTSLSNLAHSIRELRALEWDRGL